ncbi:MAG: NAD(P)H-dependent oxidoreductase [Tissierella sp.]|uniref:NAD(P)H-dependent oxidoreductase n=1 Tax=Tissierella sp. TaxID=41274 RepID=UPI003F9A8048
MKHLIIYVNPDEKSFSHEIKEYVKNFSLDQGHEIEVRDLYKVNFNPVLSLKELQMLEKDELPKDVKKEQEYLEWADFITFIYPIWWQIPAMMKGYFDRVFSYGYAYILEDDQPKGLLPKKKVLKYNPMGTPRDIYEKNGLRKAYEKAIDKGIIESTGLKIVDSILFGGNPRDHNSLRKKYLEELESSLNKAFD